MKQARKRRDGADWKARTAAREGKKRRFFTRGSLAPLAFLLCALLAAGNGEGEDWHAEKIEEELASHLSELCRHTAETKEMARTWAPLLAEDFSGMPLWGEGERIFGNEAITIETIPPHPALSRPAWIEGMAGWRAPFDAFRLKFKIVGIDLLEGEARTEARVEVFGRRGETRIGIVGTTRLHWIGPPWRIRTIEVDPLERSIVRGQAMTDITAAALSPAPEAVAQFSRGLDTWRGLLDEATGIDVYGHHGLAVGDLDNDGFDDLYVLQPGGLPNRLLRNRGDGTFEDITEATGTGILDPTPSALIADYDNDGDRDLFVFPQVSFPILLRNDGVRNGIPLFTEMPPETFRRSAPPLFGATSAAMADADNDGDLDLYLAFYAFYRPGRPVYPLPYHDARNGPPNIFFRNEGDGTFTDATQAAGFSENNDRFSFAVAWGDYDGDGDADLYVANDFGRNNFYVNDGHGHFHDAAARAGVEDIAAGMSAAWGDADNDGTLDLYVGNMWSSAGLRLTRLATFRPGDEARPLYRRHARGNSFFRNRGDGTFTEESGKWGVTMGRWAWGSDFVDLDRDGNLDLLITNGFITGPDTHDL